MTPKADLIQERRTPGLVGAGPTAPRTGKAWRDYRAALVRLRERRIETPCAGRAEWTSDRPDDVAVAIAGCTPCPIFRQCRAVGFEYKDAGTWGGVYRPAKEER